MSRTAFFRILRRWWPRHRIACGPDEQFLPASSPDADPGEVGFLSLAASLCYLALAHFVLDLFLPEGIAILLSVPVVFLFWQLLIFMLVQAHRLLQCLGMFRRCRHPQDFHVPCHLAILTLIAVGALSTPYRSLGINWLIFIAANAICAGVEPFLTAPPNQNSPEKQSTLLP